MNLMRIIILLLIEANLCISMLVKYTVTIQIYYIRTYIYIYIYIFIDYCIL